MDRDKMTNQQYSRQEKGMLSQLKLNPATWESVDNLLMRSATSTEILKSLAMNIKPDVGAEEANVLRSKAMLVVCKNSVCAVLHIEGCHAT
jgi:hypothetical protein